tara:strand:+ start:9874 stop:10014 length:141 start_codon:yes stop_codon:yes gene_type:complete
MKNLVAKELVVVSWWFSINGICNNNNCSKKETKIIKYEQHIKTTIS